VIAFRIVAFALPLASAFLAPALLAWKPGWKAASIGHAALCAPVLVAGLLAGASAGTILGVLLLSTAFAILAAGLHLAAGQVAAGLASCLLAASVLLAPRVVEEAIERNDAAAIRSRMDVLVAVSPWAVMASSLFGLDILRDMPTLYRTHLADYTDVHAPGWAKVAAWYTLSGVLLGTAAIAARRLRKRKNDS